MTAGTNPTSAPSIQADRFYDLQLAPQAQVHFVTGPRKIAEFMLAKDQQLWLQFSGEPRMQLHVTVTRSPAPKSRGAAPRRRERGP